MFMITYFIFNFILLFFFTYNILISRDFLYLNFFIKDKLQFSLLNPKLIVNIGFRSVYKEFTIFNSFRQYSIFLVINSQNCIYTKFILFLQNSNGNNGSITAKRLNLAIPSAISYTLINNLKTCISSLSLKKTFYLTRPFSFYKKEFSNLFFIDTLWLQFVMHNYVIKFSVSNYIKYITDANLQNYTILFLRKNKVFNKGRYSRNRQYYRTGVYWCLYINIIAVIGIYFWFYRLSMNFSYLWWLLFLFMLSFVIPKVIKYSLFSFKTLALTFLNSTLWLGYIFSSVIISLNTKFNLMR